MKITDICDMESLLSHLVAAKVYYLDRLNSYCSSLGIYGAPDREYWERCLASLEKTVEVFFDQPSEICLDSQTLQLVLFHMFSAKELYRDKLVVHRETEQGEFYVDQLCILELDYQNIFAWSRMEEVR